MNSIDVADLLKTKDVKYLNNSIKNVIEHLTCNGDTCLGLCGLMNCSGTSCSNCVFSGNYSTVEKAKKFLLSLKSNESTETSVDLIEEAKRRYPIGTIYKDCNSAEFIVESQNFTLPSKTVVYGEYGKGILYNNGKWAEIISKSQVDESVKSTKSLSDYTAIHVATQEHWDFVNKKLRYSWNDGAWSTFKENSCIYLREQILSSLTQFDRCSVISFPEWLKLTGYTYPEQSITTTKSEIDRNGYYEVSSQEEYEALLKWLRSKGEKVIDADSLTWTDNWKFVKYREEDWGLHAFYKNSIPVELIKLSLPDLSEFLKSTSTASKSTTSDTKERYIVKESDLVGDIAGFPIEVVQKMVDYQKKPDVTVYQNSKTKNAKGDGFTWEDSIEGHSFWDTVIMKGDFNLFFEKYPKESKSESSIKEESKSFKVRCIKSYHKLFTVGKIYNFPSPIADDGFKYDQVNNWDSWTDVFEKVLDRHTELIVNTDSAQLFKRDDGKFTTLPETIGDWAEMGFTPRFIDMEKPKNSPKIYNPYELLTDDDE